MEATRIQFYTLCIAVVSDAFDITAMEQCMEIISGVQGQAEFNPETLRLESKAKFIEVIHLCIGRR